MGEESENYNHADAVACFRVIETPESKFSSDSEKEMKIFSN